jgi:hypothetical protein
MQHSCSTNFIGESMASHIVNIPTTPEMSRQSRGRLYASGIWLRVAFIGASGLAAGLIQLFDGSAKPLFALALAVGGGAFAAFSWWRAKVSLDNIESSEERADVRPPVSSRAIAGM